MFLSKGLNRGRFSLNGYTEFELSDLDYVIGQHMQHEVKANV